MKFLSRPGFYVIALLVATMLLLTWWMSWKLDTLPQRKPIQENPPTAVSTRP